MITLSKDMEVGILEIDNQHKELIERLNSLVSMGQKLDSIGETQTTINLLGEYIIKHFNAEEELQKKNNYPEYESHREMHQHYISEFLKLKKEFEANGHSIAFTMDLNKFMINWIVKHIKSADVELGKFLKDKV
jgi:hemerythrin